ncbi:universal stress protein [[Empedobacter] haloabium]|uniref:Universal stress protein n=1 Tax=[Empedobacter] haloabium TaxID=592317 RepID=A0ABZ1UFQ5_9BURK
MYKTIVVHVSDNPAFDRRLAVAARLALEHDAHLVGSAVTGISLQAFLVVTASAVTMLAPDFDVLRQRADSQLERFADAAARLGVTSIERRLIEDDAERALLLESRYADLLVLSSGTPPEARGHLAADLPDYLALHGTRPVLVVPPDYGSDTVGRTVVVGWDAGPEATRAVTAALPLLRRAHNVIVALVNADPLTGGHGPQPGADVATWLGRHGVPVEVVREHAGDGAATALLGIARDTGADLIVAGAYGHNRIREWFIGGATRELLDAASVPLLLAH